MARYESPGYYCVVGTGNGQPTAEECTEGRIFLAEDRLVCGAGTMGAGGYADTLDTYSESTVRRLFGNRFDPQEFDINAAFDHDWSVVVPFPEIVRAEFRSWEDTRLRGADHSYAVYVDAPGALRGTLSIQLGRGIRNRGAGRKRHEALAGWLNGAASETTPEHGAKRAATGEAATTAEHAGAADPTDRNGSDAEPDPSPASPGSSPNPPSSARAGDSRRQTATADAGASPASDSNSDGLSADPTPDRETDDGQTADPPGNTSTPPSDTALDADASADRTDADVGAIAHGEDESASEPESDPTWLDREPDESALILKNRSDIRLQLRIRCRRAGEVLFVADIDLAPAETHRWREFPEWGVVHLDILFSDGSRKAEQIDEANVRSPPVGIDLYASGIEIHPAD